jgi:hypothetical protein
MFSWLPYYVVVRREYLFFFMYKHSGRRRTRVYQITVGTYKLLVPGPGSGKGLSLCIEFLAVLTPCVHSLLKLFNMYINRVHNQLREGTKSADKNC